MAHAKVQDPRHANEILQMEIARQNNKTNRTTGLIPGRVWEEALLTGIGSMRPSPVPSLLDLHLSQRSSRRVNNDHTIAFEGHNYEISATKRKTVTIVHHPSTKFRVLEVPPKTVWPTVLGAFTL
jgi:hypothetical protein